MRANLGPHAALLALLVGAAAAGARSSPARAVADGRAIPRAAQDSLATRELVRRGERIFHGREASGLCSVCHGDRGRGTYAGPSLADSVWIHGDGSFDSILRVIVAGVDHPAHHRGRMIAAGGMPLTDEQLRAVAAYVHSLQPRRAAPAPPRTAP